MRGRPSDSVASMWKWQSTKGGETSRPGGVDLARGLGGDVRLDRGDLAAGAGDVDVPAAPSGRVAFLTRRSKVMGIRACISASASFEARSFDKLRIGHLRMRDCWLSGITPTSSC